ncbi:hypothetical protein VIGAN_01311500 [Vigna angularis var. angularis]|uniref:Uncharacterized protein n=1 Tax=Vigna angularis var. angularis TaxID=157739 RepID=A0A0S3R404_PHAAN|nr:hypothetical protein VIGAN_01311500 [Vigna angularis var. angularis]
MTLPSNHVVNHQKQHHKTLHHSDEYREAPPPIDAKTITSNCTSSIAQPSHDTTTESQGTCKNEQLTNTPLHHSES